jgi:hypothetical protein
MRAIVVIIFSLIAAAPAAAQYPDLRPRGAVPHHGRSVAITTRPPAYAGGWGYNHYAYGPNCLYYGYPPNCAYWELPDWNGGMEIRNPGGG